MRVKKTVTQEQWQKEYSDLNGQIDLRTNLVDVIYSREPLTFKEILSNLLDFADRQHGLYITYFTGCSEPGYNDKPIVAADWNEPRLRKIGDWLGRRFNDVVSVEWQDEWTGCSHCNKAVRTSPSSYGWLPAYMWLSDCEIVCPQCFETYTEELISSYVNQTGRAVPPGFYPLLKKAGFICYSPDEYCQRFKTVFYTGQNDDPKTVARQIEKELPDYDYIFKLDCTGQFDLTWCVYLRKKETED